MNTTISVRFPKALYQRLRQHAQALASPLSEVIVQTVEHGLPIWINMISTEQKKELARLENMGDTSLERIAFKRFPIKKQRKLDQLLQKHAENKITPKEIVELDKLQIEANFLTLRKAKALALLRNREFHISPPGNRLPEN